jgi:hypothetical protein
MNDTQYPIHKRIENWKAYLKEFYIEREQEMMRLFRERNGFEAWDDDAKRQLIDMMYFEAFHRYPQDDDERDRCVFSQQVDRQLMRVGWRPNKMTEKEINDAFVMME